MDLACVARMLRYVDGSPHRSMAGYWRRGISGVSRDGTAYAMDGDMGPGHPARRSRRDPGRHHGGDMARAIWYAAIMRADGTAATDRAEADRIAQAAGCRIRQDEDPEAGAYSIEITRPVYDALRRDGGIDIQTPIGAIAIEMP